LFSTHWWPRPGFRWPSWWQFCGPWCSSTRDRPLPDCSSRACSHRP